MNDYEARAGETFEATLDGATGLAGPLTVAIYDTPSETTAAYGPSSTGIVENPAGSGLYAVTLTAPAANGTYSIVWSDGVLFARDTLEVTTAIEVPRTLLARMTSANTEPVLSTEDLDALLTLSRIPDSTGLTSADAAWVPTYDYNFAAAEGWRWKAGKAAASYAFTMDGDSPERSFLMIRCEKMAAAYARKVVTSVPVVSDRRAYPGYIPLI